MSNESRQLFSESVIRASLALSITSGVLSVLGSTTTIVVILRSPKRFNSTYRRLVFGMSCMDILFSLSYVAAGLPAPKDMASWMSLNAIGNIATCNIQGFINHSGLIGSLLYACVLSIYFVMVVVYSHRENFIQKKIEPFFHALSILISFGSGVFLMVTNNFNDGGNLCMIQDFPFDCSNTDGKVECTRGKRASQYVWYFEGFPIALLALIITACMARLSCSVGKKLKKMEIYGANEFITNVQRKRRNILSSSSCSTGAQPQIRQRRMNVFRKTRTEKKAMLTQAGLYVMVLGLTFSFALIWQIIGQHIWLFLLQMTFVPLLGFFNFFIFIRPRVVIIRQSKPELNLFRAFISAIISKEIIAPSRRRSIKRRWKEDLKEEDENIHLKFKKLGCNSLADTSNMIKNAEAGLSITTEPDNIYRYEESDNISLTNSHEVQEIDDPSNMREDAEAGVFNTTESSIICGPNKLGSIPLNNRIEVQVT